jgi:ATP-dependent DNA helicase PIF1
MTTAKRKIRACIPSSYVELESENLRTKRINPMVTLKVGTHVMCTQNVDETLCNGSQGVVVRFEQGLPVVQWWNGTRLVRPYTIESEKVPGVAVLHMPLMYAWAVTIHKAQGATLHSALIDVGTGIFEAGQTYTALSRLSSLDFLYLTSFDPNKIKTNPAVIAFYEKLAERATSATDNLIETRGI